MSKISVIMPVYQAEQYVAEAIESILMQTRRPFELIVIDDGSTDRTASIVSKYKEVKYIYQHNQGPSRARNTAIQLSTGDYIAIHDADDRSLPQRLELQANVLDSNPGVDLVYCDVNVIDAEGRTIYALRSEGIYPDRNNFLAAVLERQVIPCLPAIMGRRHCFEAVPYPEHLVHGEDYYLTIEMAKRFQYFYIPDLLYEYRRHAGNLTNQHQLQIAAERQIIRNLGRAEIIHLVNQTTDGELVRKLRIAKILMKIELYAEAAEILRDITNHAIGHFLSGVCHYQLGALPQAQEQYANALHFEPQLAEAMNNLGCILCRNGQIDEARRLFQEALVYRPSYMDAQNNLLELSQQRQPSRITLRPLRHVLMTYMEQ